MNLTREQIEAAEGRELDALVAERVMGWKWVKIPDFSREKQLGVRWNRIRALCPPCGNPPADMREKTIDTGHLKPFSTDIAAAWLVLERMKSMGWEVSVTWENWNECPGEPLEYCWSAEYNYYTNDERDFRQAFAQADTAPLAICRTALLVALGHTLGTTTT